MKKQLFIHIGLYKTGTTAIQSTLARNYNALLKQGILYPKSGRYLHQHSILCAYLHSPNKIPPKYDIYSEYDYVNCWSNFVEEAQSSPANKIVLSVEGLSCIKRVKHLQKIVKYCRFFDTKIIVYLRRQDQFLQSLYNQNIKSLHVQSTDDINQFLDRQIHSADFKTLLHCWSRVFGRENMLIRIYEKAQLPNGLMDDFMSLIGCNYKNFIPPEITNSSLPLRYLEIVRMINQEGLSSQQHRQFIKMIQAVDMPGHNKITMHHLFSPQQCHDIMQRFLMDNKKIARRYLHRKDGKLFRQPLPNIDEPWEREKPISPEKIITEFLLSDITKNKTKPLTAERVIKELLVPYLRETAPVSVTKQKLSVVKRLRCHMKQYSIKHISSEIYRKIKRAV